MNQGLVTEQIVIEEVKKAIVETLGVEASTIQADSSLMKDLGAESLDFLDISYRLEQAFGIKMARHSVLEHIEEVFGEDSAIDGSGQLTELAVRLLRTRLDEGGTALTPGMAGARCRRVPRTARSERIRAASDPHQGLGAAP